MDNNFDSSLLTLKEAMEYLKLSRSTMYKLMDNGEIKGVKIGKLWRFRKSDLEAFVNQKANDQ